MAVKKKTTATPAKNGSPVTTNLGELCLVALDQIDPDSFENQRTGDFTRGDSSDEGSAFKELVESIETTGQKDPITIRPKAKGRHGRKLPYEVIKGFRRYAAVKLIAQKNGIKNAKISVIIKDLTDLEALEENVFENTARDNLGGPDLAWAAWTLSQTYAANGETVSDNQLAGRMGKNQSYISKLMRIIKQGPEVAKLWRDTPISIPVNTIEHITSLKPELQVEEFDRVVKAGSKPGRKGPGGKDPVDIALAQAKRVATLLGRLQVAGLITCDIGWSESLAVLGVSIKDLSVSEKKAVGRAAKEAFAMALAEADKVTAPAEEEVASN